MKSSKFAVGLFLIIFTISQFLQPSQIQANGIQNILDKAYITSYSTGVVDVVDLKTNTVEKAKITVGREPNSAGFNPNGTQVFVTNRADNNVSVIDPASDKVIKTISVGHQPHGVAFSPDGKKAYVANRSSSSLSIIDTNTLEVSNTITVPSTPTAMVVVDNKIYLTTQLALVTIDINTDTVINQIPLSDPYGLSVNPKKTKLYVAQRSANTVSVIDIVNNTLEATVAVGISPHATEVSPDGTRVYTVNASSSSVSVIDTSSNTVIDTISVGSSPYVVGLSKDGKYVYTVNYGSHNMSVIDTATHTVVEAIDVSSGPFMVGTFMVPTAISSEPPKSSNAELASLSLDNGVWSQKFNKDVTEYQINVGSDVESITLTPELADAKATVTVNGTVVSSGQASHQIQLNTEKATNITIMVTAENGTVKTYTLTVNRLEKVVVSSPIAVESAITVRDEEVQQLDTNGEFVIKLDEQLDMIKEVHFSKEQLAALKTKQATVKITKSDVQLQIPIENFNQEEELVISLEKLEKNPNVLPHSDLSTSAIYEFTIQLGDEIISKFDSPIELAFPVVGAKKPEELKVYYWNKERNEWELVGGTYENGFIKTTTDHFSTFGVFHPTDFEQPITNNDNEDQPNQEVIDNQPVQQDADENSQTSQEENTSSAKKETGSNKLPNTATNTYNWLIVGVVLVLSGVAAGLRQRRLRKS
ncbi:YVTN family beta-propeller repeat protein [Cytobacillus gottheilii]|uniref:YVTN family beta-propeller repeat protein n=1 Tax=Cytobacillus gottheilii TaxID=859144 RepID=UPI0009BB4DE7|nr:cadherin-like beta sandwich domain-containing protein [Cytobacillus gottheilii]